MRIDEIADLFVYAYKNDVRLTPRTDADYQASLAAWHTHLEPVEARFAADYVRRYYQNEDPRQYPVTAGMIRDRWDRDQTAREQRQRETLASREIERHCRQAACPCTHTDPCFCGWITVEEPYPLTAVHTAPGKTPTHDVNYRCPTCAGYLSQRLVMDGKDPLPPYPPPPDHVWRTDEDNDPENVDPDLRDAVMAMMRDTIRNVKRP